jgi:hypothetical protein
MFNEKENNALDPQSINHKFAKFNSLYYKDESLRDNRDLNRTSNSIIKQTPFKLSTISLVVYELFTFKQHIKDGIYNLIDSIMLVICNQSRSQVLIMFFHLNCKTKITTVQSP